MVVINTSFVTGHDKHANAIDLSNAPENGKGSHVVRNSIHSTLAISPFGIISKLFVPLMDDHSTYLIYHKSLPLPSSLNCTGHTLQMNDSIYFENDPFHTKIKHFEARENGRCVVVSWIIEPDQRPVDFHLYRSDRLADAFEPVCDNTVPIAYLIHPENHYVYEDYGVEKGRSYYYKLVCQETEGRATSHGPIAVTLSPPHIFELEQNYPNPFNPSTTIAFSLPRSAPTSLVIYNLHGQAVRTLINQFMNCGRHIVIWDGRDDKGQPVASGIYFYTLMNEELHKTRRMQLVR